MFINLLWEAAHGLKVIEFEVKTFKIEKISQNGAYWIDVVLHNCGPHLILR